MLVQKVEGFLETLDRNKLVREDMRTKIMLCVDGSDFRLPKVASGDEEPIKQLVAEYLSKSDFLIAFVGPDSRTHPWIRWEIQWWLEHREVETLLVALTGGDDPEADPASLFPPEIVSAGAHRRIWFDLRGFHRRARRSARSLRSFDRELVRLAAYLCIPSCRPTNSSLTMIRKPSSRTEGHSGGVPDITPCSGWRLSQAAYYWCEQLNTTANGMQLSSLGSAPSVIRP